MQLQDRINTYVNSYNTGKQTDLLADVILNDPNIRRLILANFNDLLKWEIEQGRGFKARLYAYKYNSYDVWKQNKKKGSQLRYLTVNQVIIYLNLLGYQLDYFITQLDNHDKLI